MSRHRITEAQLGELLTTKQWAARRTAPPATSAQLKRLERNAADPVKARNYKPLVGRERDVQAAIEDYLRAEGLVVIPINSGAATIIGGRKCLKGVPDLMTWIPQGRIFVESKPATQWGGILSCAVVCFVEVKRPAGGRYSKEQLAFRDRAVQDGCLWIGATCVEDVKMVIPPRSKR